MRAQPWLRENAGNLVCVKNVHMKSSRVYLVLIFAFCAIAVILIGIDSQPESQEFHQNIEEEIFHLELLQESNVQHKYIVSINNVLNEPIIVPWGPELFGINTDSNISYEVLLINEQKLVVHRSSALRRLPIMGIERLYIPPKSTVRKLIDLTMFYSELPEYSKVLLIYRNTLEVDDQSLVKEYTFKDSDGKISTIRTVNDVLSGAYKSNAVSLKSDS